MLREGVRVEQVGKKGGVAPLHAGHRGGNVDREAGVARAAVHAAVRSSAGPAAAAAQELAAAAGGCVVGSAGTSREPERVRLREGW